MRKVSEDKKLRAWRLTLSHLPLDFLRLTCSQVLLLHVSYVLFLMLKACCLQPEQPLGFIIHKVQFIILTKHTST